MERWRFRLGDSEQASLNQLRERRPESRTPAAGAIVARLTIANQRCDCQRGVRQGWRLLEQSAAERPFVTLALGDDPVFDVAKFFNFNTHDIASF